MCELCGRFNVFHPLNCAYSLHVFLNQKAGRSRFLKTFLYVTFIRESYGMSYLPSDKRDTVTEITGHTQK